MVQLSLTMANRATMKSMVRNILKRQAKNKKQHSKASSRKRPGAMTMKEMAQIKAKVRQPASDQATVASVNSTTTNAIAQANATEQPLSTATTNSTHTIPGNHSALNTNLSNTTEPAPATSIPEPVPAAISNPSTTSAASSTTPTPPIVAEEPSPSKHESTNTSNYTMNATQLIEDVEAGVHNMEDVIAMTAHSAGTVMNWYSTIINQMIKKNATTNGSASLATASAPASTKKKATSSNSSQTPASHV